MFVESNLVALFLFSLRIVEALVVNIKSSKAKKSYWKSNSYS